MKKLLLLISLLTCFVGTAQDLAFLRSMTQKQAIDFAYSIANNTGNKWDSLMVKETDNYLKVFFVSNTTSAERREQIIGKKIFSDKDETFIVVFTAFKEGENKSLEIEGVKKYKFYSVTLKFLDLFPTWKQYFDEQAIKENVLTNYDAQKRRDMQNLWIYDFTKSDEPYWTLICKF